MEPQNFANHTRWHPPFHFFVLPVMLINRPLASRIDTSSSSGLEIAISAARSELADVVSRAHYAGRITYLTRRGERLAAIVPVEVAEAIERAEDAADVLKAALRG